MGKIDEAILALERTTDGTDRALQLAGLISTLFKLKQIALVVTGQLAYDIYANTSSAEYPELELSVIAGELAPRSIMEIMRGQLYARGSLYQWTIAAITIRFKKNAAIANIDLCRDFTTNHGVVLVQPLEEILADRILAAVYPQPDSETHEQAHSLLMSGLAEAFMIDWTVLHTLCHRPDYRIGEDLAKMRLAAKRELDTLGTEPDRVGASGKLPTITAPLPPDETPAPEDEVNVVHTPEPEPAPDSPADSGVTPPEPIRVPLPLPTPDNELAH